jgi:anti-sigma factor RsiW
MSCEREETLSALADGRCSPAEEKELRGHLAACADCRRALRWLQAGKAALAGMPAAKAPPELKASLLAAAAEAARRKKARAWSRRWDALKAWLTPRPVGFGLAAGLAACAVTLVVRAGRPAETVSLDEMLAAHRTYALTMPLNNAETTLTGLADALAGGRP